VHLGERYSVARAERELGVVRGPIKDGAPDSRESILQVGAEGTTLKTKARHVKKMHFSDKNARLGKKLWSEILVTSRTGKATVKSRENVNLPHRH